MVNAKYTDSAFLTKKVFSLCPEFFVYIFTNLINKSLVTSIYPSELKIAKVIPVFKKGNKHLIENYRPISILCSLNKLYERVLYSQMFKFLSENKLLSDQQYGFVTKKSTEGAFLSLISKVTESINEGKICVVIFLDYAKAFDSICPQILFHKLKNIFNFSDSSVKLIESYLSNRQQYCVWNKSESSTKPIKFGVY